MAGFRIEAAGPVHFHEWISGQELSVRAIQYIEEAVAVSPHHELAWRSAPVCVDEDGDLRGVVVVWIVRSELVEPFQLAGIGVQRDDGIGIEVVAFALRRIPVRARVSGSPEREVQCGIVRTRGPDRAASMLPVITLPCFVSSLAGTGNGV